MNTEYTYEIIKVDHQARCMEVVYSCEGHQTVHIGARLPYVNESLLEIIRMFAPLTYWQEQETEVIVPTLASGSISVTDHQPVKPSYKEQRKAEYRDQADSIFFKWQRGEATQRNWLDKIAEIQERFPEDGSGPVFPSIPVTEV